MNIEGTYTLQATPEEVWRCLMDPQVLQRAIPGVERLERQNSHCYAVALHIRQAPLIGLYQGYVTISEQQYPCQYHIIIEGEGRQSKFSGEGIIQLSRHDEHTVVAYRGMLNPGKLVTLLPPPLVQGAAKMLIQQFFTELAEYLRTLNRVEISVSLADMQNGEMPDQEYREEAEILADEAESRIGFFPSALFPAGRRPLLLAIVRRLGLGAGNPAEEARWVVRARRLGLVMTLLTLVWIGTRLPRR